MTWTSAADDIIVPQVGRRLIDEIYQVAQTKGLFNSFKYLNYADVDQSPIVDYRPEIQTKLKAIGEKYDPSGFFQRAMAGAFKLPSP